MSDLVLRARLVQNRKTHKSNVEVEDLDPDDASSAKRPSRLTPIKTTQDGAVESCHGSVNRSKVPHQVWIHRIAGDCVVQSSAGKQQPEDVYDQGKQNERPQQGLRRIEHGIHQDS